MVKTTDFTPEMIEQICYCLNRSNEVTIKLEKENIAIVEIKRRALSKTPIEEGHQGHCYVAVSLHTKSQGNDYKQTRQLAEGTATKTLNAKEVINWYDKRNVKEVWYRH